MCFDCGEGTTCGSVRIDGTAVTWIAQGEEAGTGTISGGNPNNF